MTRDGRLGNVEAISLAPLGPRGLLPLSEYDYFAGTEVKRREELQSLQSAGELLGPFGCDVVVRCQIKMQHHTQPQFGQRGQAHQSDADGVGTSCLNLVSTYIFELAAKLR